MGQVDPKRPPQTRGRVSREVLVDEAVALVDREGPEALSLSELARRFEVRTPSLYHHVQGRAGLESALVCRFWTLQGERASVAAASADPLRALAHGSRALAEAHPGLYALGMGATPRAEDEAMQQARARAMAEIFRALRASGVRTPELIHVARAFRALVHGFVSLELSEAFAMETDVDVSFDRAIDAFKAGFQLGSTGS